MFHLYWNNTLAEMTNHLGSPDPGFSGNGLRDLDSEELWNVLDCGIAQTRLKYMATRDLVLLNSKIRHAFAFHLMQF